MPYTLSFDASEKLKKLSLKGIINHHFRSVLEMNGINLDHSNANIIKDKTHENMSMYFDQTQNTFLSCTSTKQIEDSLQTRLATVKKPLRQDAVLCRCIILQLDPNFYADAGADNDAKDDSYFNMLSWATKTFGTKNLVGCSIHKDETNPHIHILFAPVTDDGRLSQKDWFANPVTLREMHEDFRSHMHDRGYDIEMKRQPKRTHLNDKDYKLYREAKSTAEQLKLQEQELKNRQQQTNTAIRQRENALREQELALHVKSQSLDDKSSKLDKTLTDANKIYQDCAKLQNKLSNCANGYLSNPINRLNQRDLNKIGSQLDESLLPHGQRNRDHELSL